MTKAIGHSGVRWRRLPSGERTAVILYYLRRMAVSDIARALGVTIGTIKTFLFSRQAPSSRAPEDPISKRRRLKGQPDDFLP
jgi:DNA-directed RNA polymerase specialized sigma24 family protein